MGIWLEVDQPEALGQDEADGDEEDWRRDDCLPCGNNPPHEYRRDHERERGDVHEVISPYVGCGSLRYGRR
jgi:hypothetical protein